MCGIFSGIFSVQYLDVLLSAVFLAVFWAVFFQYLKLPIWYRYLGIWKEMPHTGTALIFLLPLDTVPIGSRTSL